MALSQKPYKGSRDFYPEDKRLQKYIFSKWREAVEAYGYEEYDSPVIEPIELYLAKSGDEIVNEQTYIFEDRGKRKVAIRPEMTPSVSRLVAAKRQELAYPLRWYSIPNLWRYERPQKGRLREHWQLNVDIFGVKSTNAEVELISLTDFIFKLFGATPDQYIIKINHRQVVDMLMKDVFKLPIKSAQKLYKLIDRMHKLETKDFLSQLDDILSSQQKESGLSELIMTTLAISQIKDLPEPVKKSEAYNDLKMVISQLKSLGIDNITYDPTLMRGFDYYTGIIFEVFDTNPANNRSMMGGGRYDGLVGLFGVEPIPTAGFGWGDVTLINFLSENHLIPELKVETAVYVALVSGVNNDINKIVNRLRRSGINTAVDLSGKKLGDQFKTALKKGISRVIIIGEEEIKSGKLKLRDLDSSKEVNLTLEDVIKQLK